MRRDGVQPGISTQQIQTLPKVSRYHRICLHNEEALRKDSDNYFHMIKRLFNLQGRSLGGKALQSFEMKAGDALLFPAIIVRALYVVLLC